MSQDLSGGTYSIVLRDLAFQICPSFWDFASCLSCSATRFGNPLRNFFPLATATNHCRKIKNPASSAGRNHSVWSGSTRCSTSFYPVLVKNPTIGSTSRLCFSRAGRLLDPTVMPLSGPRLFRALEPSVMIPAFLNSSSPPINYFFLRPVHPVQIPRHRFKAYGLPCPTYHPSR